MMKKIVAFLSAFAIAFSGITYSPAVVEAAPANPGDNVWQQVWSDEFNGNSLNTGNWTYEYGGSDGGGWGNNELQCYTDKGDNVYVSDGTLKIKAKREDYGGCRYTSGRLKTAGKKSFKYGKMEARIRVHGGNQDGVWPAFWMMGDDGQPWPSCGELDIMEHANGRNYVEGTIHWNENGLQSQVGYNHVFWGSYANNRYYWFDNNDSNGITAWHTYGVTWDDSCIKWYVDNNVYEEAYLGANNAYAFQKAHYFLLNLALGSNATPYTGNVAPNQWFSEATMEVDYVRAFTYNPSGGSVNPGGSGSDTPSGYVDGNADNNWHNFGVWNYLVGGDARLAYQNNSSQNNCNVYIKNKGGWDWCTQVKTNLFNVENGAKYNYSITVNSDKGSEGAVVGNLEDERGGEAGYKQTLFNQGIGAGNTTFKGEFVADGTKADVVINLSNLAVGTNFKVTNFTITKVGAPTQAPTQAPQTEAPTTKKSTVDPNSANYADIENGPGLKYSTGTDATIVNVQNPGWTEGGYSGAGVYFHVPAGIESIKVNNGAGAHIEGAGGLVFLSALKKGINTIDVNYAGGSVTFYIKKEEVATTAAPTTTKENIPDGFAEGKENELVNLNAWSYYFVTGWTGAKGYVKGGNSLNDFAIKIKEQTQAAWGTQIIPKVTLDANAKYNYKLVVNSTSADNFVVNEDIKKDVSNTLINEKLKVGDQTFTGSFTTQQSGEKIVMSLGELANGAVFTVKEFVLEKVQETTTAQQTTKQVTTKAETQATNAQTQATTQPATNANIPSGNIDASIDKPVGLTYAGNDNLPFFFAWAQDNSADGYNVFVDGNYVSTVTVGNVNLGENLFANGDEHIVAIQTVKGDKVSYASAIKYNKKTNESVQVQVDNDLAVVTTTVQQTTTAQQTTTVQQTTTAQQSTVEQTTKAADTTHATTKAADTTQATTKVADTTQATTNQSTTAQITTKQSTTAQATTKQSTTAQATTKQDTVAQTTTKEVATKAPETQPAIKAQATEKHTVKEVKLGKAVVKSVKKKKAAKKLTIKIKKIADVTGYQVAVYKSKKNAKKNKKAVLKKFIKKNTAKLVVKSAKLKNKKKLFIKVRAYTKSSAGTVYGSWSAVKRSK